MSASLVGSEMCIRDSAWPAQTQALYGQAELGGWHRAQVAMGSRPPLCPVSYTHLTLPTIA
eukprot:15021932-Alexandrium_andersonii.AAC.1